MTRTYIKGLAVIAMFLSLTASNASAANSIDLTTKGSSATGTAANDAEITWIAQQTSISSKGNEGVLDSFVRLRDRGDTNEQGYNTDARPLQFDEKKSPNVTHSLLLSEVPVVNIQGVDYRQFVLNINQKKGETTSLLSLNQVQIFLRDAGNLASATLLADPTTTTPPAIDVIDLVSTEGVRLNNGDNENFSQLQLKDLNPKKKPGDYFFYVADAAFQAVVDLIPGRQYVYLYSQFGTPPGTPPNGTTPTAFPTNGKFEEWAVLQNAPNPVPEPPSVALVLTGLGTLGLAGLRRRHRSE
jgi:hypothetical protein